MEETIITCEINHMIPQRRSGVPSANVVPEMLASMLTSGTMSDVSFKIGGELLKAHKCILAQNSAVLHAMFSQKGVLENQKGVIAITDSNPDVVRSSYCIHDFIIRY